MSLSSTLRDAPQSTGALRSAAYRAIWISRTARGELIWRWLAVAYGAYWVLFVAGAYLNRTQLNNVGAVFILIALGWATMERLWVKLDSVAIACIVAAILPLLVALSTHATRYPDAMIKQISLYIAMAISRILRLPAISQSATRGFFAAQILIVLALSFLTDHGGVWDAGTRHSGLFANPNNLALIPLLLLFLPNPRDARWVRFAPPAVLVAVLAITRTSGSIIASAVGLGIHFRSMLSKRARSHATVVAIAVLVLAILAVFGGASLLPESRLANQIAVMGTELNTVLEGKPVAFYDEERTLGPGSASGVWRLEHWRRTFATYAGGSPAQILVGFGMGSTPDYMGKLPHNDYLRVLFEQGLIGFGLFIFAWFRIIRTAPPEVRYCGLILAIYSFSENNLDNFPFMSLFILFLSSGSSALRRKPGTAQLTMISREEFA